MTYRLGTDRQCAPTGSPDWYLSETTGLPRLLARFEAAVLPRLRRVGPDGVRGDFPAGVGHAVPGDSPVALCGVTPAHLWKGDFDPRSRVVDPCPRCVGLLPPPRG